MILAIDDAKPVIGLIEGFHNICIIAYCHISSVALSCFSDLCGNVRYRVWFRLFSEIQKGGGLPAGHRFDVVVRICSSPSIAKAARKVGHPSRPRNRLSGDGSRGLGSACSTLPKSDTLPGGIRFLAHRKASQRFFFGHLKRAQFLDGKPLSGGPCRSLEQFEGALHR